MILIILDGWGYSEDTRCNAIHEAHKPVWDKLWAHYPHTLIQGSGRQVGLPAEQMGNSEVGHLNLGAGRVVYQEYTRIDKAISEQAFDNNEVLLAAIAKAITNDGAIHIMGLLSPGGVHSHELQIQAMVRLAAARGGRKVFLHAFLDGRDTPPKSAMASLQAMDDLFAELGRGRIASLIGRYYAMDRDQRWERIQAAYELLCSGKGVCQAENATAGLTMAYERGETDEFVQATAIVPHGDKAVRMQPGDVAVFMNFRADRARQLTQAFIAEEFSDFDRGPRLPLGEFVSLTEYRKEFNIPVAFPPARLHNVLGE